MKVEQNRIHLQTHGISVIFDSGIETQLIHYNLSIGWMEEKKQFHWSIVRTRDGKEMQGIVYKNVRAVWMATFFVIIFLFVIILITIIIIRVFIRIIGTVLAVRVFRDAEVARSCWDCGVERGNI